MRPKTVGYVVLNQHGQPRRLSCGNLVAGGDENTIFATRGEVGRAIRQTKRDCGAMGLNWHIDEWRIVRLVEPPKQGKKNET